MLAVALALSGGVIAGGGDDTAAGGDKTAAALQAADDSAETPASEDSPEAKLAMLEEKVAELDGKVTSLYREVNDYQALSKETGDGISLFLGSSLETLTAAVVQKQVTVEGALAQIMVIDGLARQGQITAKKLSEMTDPGWPIQGAYAENRMICRTAVTYCEMLRAYAEYRNDANLDNLNMIRTTMRQQLNSHFPQQ